MIELIENIDLYFPFDEKFYFYNSDKSIIYYEYSNVGLGETIFFTSMCLSLIKEGKSVLYITANKANQIFLKNNYSKFFNPKYGELFFASKRITTNNLKKFLNKKIDCIIIENIAECNVGAQIPTMFFEFDIEEDISDKIDFLKNKILKNIEFLNIPFIILGNSNKSNLLDTNNLNYMFKINLIEFEHYDGLRIILKVDDLKNRYSEEIYHKPITFTIGAGNYNISIK